MLTKRQEAELVTAIQGRGEIPLKFSYLGEGAEHWATIARERSGGDGINSFEVILLKKRLDDFLSTLDLKNGINILDIGCGDGVPVFPILEKLKNDGVPFKYVPIDISQEMLDLAEKTLKEKIPDLVCEKVQTDFEIGQFSEVTHELKKDGSVNLLLFLGSTLGNHSDLSRVLTNFRDSMTSKDYLIVGVELTNLAKVQKIIPHYETKAVDNLVTFMLNYLKVPKENYSYEALWNEKYNQIEMRATFSKDSKIEIAGESFLLAAGENILLARSIKFTESFAMELFSGVGFRTELLTTAEDRGYLLTMIQPTRYSV